MLLTLRYPVNVDTGGEKNRNNSQDSGISAQDLFDVLLFLQNSL